MSAEYSKIFSHHSNLFWIAKEISSRSNEVTPNRHNSFCFLWYSFQNSHLLTCQLISFFPIHSKTTIFPDTIHKRLFPKVAFCTHKVALSHFFLTNPRIAFIIAEQFYSTIIPLNQFYLSYMLPFGSKHFCKSSILLMSVNILRSTISYLFH